MLRPKPIEALACLADDDGFDRVVGRADSDELCESAVKCGERRRCEVGDSEGRRGERGGQQRERGEVLGVQLPKHEFEISHQYEPFERWQAGFEAWAGTAWL